MPRMRLDRTLWLLIVVCALVPKALFAELLVYPTRGMITDRQRVVTFALRHTGAQPETYKITLQYYRMHPDGTDTQVTEPTPEDRAALTFLRFSPRKVTLAPNVEQTVRVMLGDTKGLTDGDYRAHIHFEPSGEAPEARSVASEGKGKSEESVSMTLTTKVSVAIPVIYRRGNASVKVSLTKPTIVAKPEGPQVQFDMLKEGNAFAYGDYFATFTPKGGAPVQVGIIKGVPSYIPKRLVTIGLTPPKGTKVAAGSLRIEFREHDGKPEAPPIALAETAIP